MRTTTVTDEVRISAEVLAAAGIHSGDEVAISVDRDGVHIAPREIFDSGAAFFDALEAEIDPQT